MRPGRRGRQNQSESDIARSEMRIRRAAVWTAAVFVLVSGLLFRVWIIPAFVALGAGLAWLNFRWLAAAVSGVVIPGNPEKIKYLVVKFLLRLVLILAVLYATIRVSFAAMMGLLLGLSVYVLAIMLEAVRALFQTRKTNAGT